MHPCSLGRGQARAERVGHREHLTHGLAELLSPVRVDPALVPRVRRAAADQLLADLPVDPVARQDGADALGERPGAGDRQQVAGVCEVARRGLGRRDHRGIEAEGGEQRAVQLLLDGDRLRGMPGEHLGRRLVQSPGSDQSERPGVVSQVQGILRDVERERVGRQRAVGQPGDERMREYRVVDPSDALPQLPREAHRITPACSACTGPSPPPSPARPCATASPATVAACRAASARPSPAASPAASAAECVQPAP